MLQVPAELIGLVAKRGHDALLRRLLSFNAQRHVPPILRTSAPPQPPPAPTTAVRVLPRHSQTAEQTLLACLDSLLEASIISGDHDATSVLAPCYNPQDRSCHLNCNADVLASFTALAIARSDQAALGALRDAGAVEWCRVHGDHVTLSHLLRQPDRALYAAALVTRAPVAQLAPPAAQLFEVPSIVKGDCTDRGGLRVAAAPADATAQPGISSVTAQPTALALAACQADTQTVDALLEGAFHVDDLTRVIRRGDAQLVSALFAGGGVRHAGARGATEEAPSNKDGQVRGFQYESAADVLKKYGIYPIGAVGAMGPAGARSGRVIPLGETFKAASAALLQSVPDDLATLHDALRMMESATISLAASSGAVVSETTSHPPHDGAGVRPHSARANGLPPSGRSLCEALSEMQVAMSELRVEADAVRHEPEPDKAAVSPQSLSGSLLNLELTLKQLAGTDFAFRSTPAGADAPKPTPLQARHGLTAAEQLLDSVARATEAIGGPQTLAGYQAARSQALTRKMGIMPGLDGSERVRNHSVPNILIPRPEMPFKMRPTAQLQTPSFGAPPSPTDDQLWASLLGDLAAPRMQTARADPKVVRKHAGQFYRRLPPPPFAPPTLLPPTGTDADTPTGLIPEPTRRSRRPLYLGNIPTSPFERSDTAILEGKPFATAMVEPRLHADKYHLGEQPTTTSAYAPGHHAKLAAKSTAAAIKANTLAIKALALT